jgi:hypothetical protein
VLGAYKESTPEQILYAASQNYIEIQKIKPHTFIYNNPDENAYETACKEWDVAYETLTNLSKKNKYDSRGDAERSHLDRLNEILYDTLRLRKNCTTKAIEERYMDITDQPYPFATDRKFVNIHIAARLLHCKETRKLYDRDGANTRMPGIITLIKQMSPLKYELKRRLPYAKDSPYAHDNDILEEAIKTPEIFARKRQCRKP